MTEHIKMPDVLPIARFNANGTQTVFYYTFPIFASEDLKVYQDGALQVSGYDISGAGSTSGGSVTFDVAPASGTIITLARELSIERVTDFLEGGDFSAQSINNELDYMVAALQQVDHANDLMLKYGDHETPGQTQLPDRDVRANKALGFDGDGNPVAVSLEGSMAAPDFTPTGTGADTRTSTDKFSDLISVKDFGAVGDGLTNDTIAIQNALAAHDTVLLPNGTYLTSATIVLRARQALIGLGQNSIIQAQDNSFNTIEIQENNCAVQNLRIEGGLTGIKLFGETAECTQNVISDVQIIGATTGIMLDGYEDVENPCYWNNFARILIEQPTLHGVHLLKSAGGDTPNANRFHAVRVYSKGAETTGSGFYVQHGALNNSFVDCEASLNGDTADSCVRIGAGASDTLVMNMLTESWNVVSNVKLDSGSTGTILINLNAQSNGAAIEDNSGGQYNAYNAGYPEKNTLRKTVVTDMRAALMRFDTAYIDTAGTTALDLAQSVHLVNTVNGDITIELPAAADSNRVMVFVKKVDDSDNILTITEDSGNGPDGVNLILGGVNDYALMISNGAHWYVMASNRMAAGTRYIDSSGTVDIDMSVSTYLLSSYGGAMTARLPPANAEEAKNRSVTLKKTDPSANAVTVTEQGGSGPDGSSKSLATQFDAITVMSNGASWFVVSRYP